jgi:hypothetical protein
MGGLLTFIAMTMASDSTSTGSNTAAGITGGGPTSSILSASSNLIGSPISAPQASSGLSQGEKAGIMVGVVMVVAAIVCRVLNTVYKKETRVAIKLIFCYGCCRRH